MKPCRTCGGQWGPRIQGQRYCSDECNPNIATCAKPECLNTFKTFSKQKFCSPECRGPAYGIMKISEPKTCLGCGTTFLSDRKLIKYCADSCKPDWKKCALPSCTTMGLFPHTTKFCRDHINRGDKIRPSAEELALVPVLKDWGYEHTGDGRFWITWKDGTNHNPDFIDRRGRRVVEYFGKYWHRHQRGQEEVIKQAYREVGWECEILWTEDYHRLVPGMKVH